VFLEGFSEVEKQWFRGGPRVLEVEVLVSDDMILGKRKIELQDCLRKKELHLMTIHEMIEEELLGDPRDLGLKGVEEIDISA
jgi:hypothetical protein